MMKYDERSTTHQVIIVLLLAILCMMAIQTVFAAYRINDILNAIRDQTKLMQQTAQDDQYQQPASEDLACPSQMIGPQVVRYMSPIKAHCTITTYKPIRRETDSTPQHTAIMERPIPGWTCAVSRDLSAWLGGRIWIEGVGVRRVNDLMHQRFQKRVDLCVGESVPAVDGQKMVVFLGKG